MILQLDDWKFDIDMARTMEYSAAEAAEHCDCAYCRNFYAAVDQYYPEFRAFMAQFGLDIEAPDELMPFDFEGEMYYDGAYMVCGRILQAGQAPLEVSGIRICATVDDGSGEMIRFNHSCPAPCFALDISSIILPWVLDEPISETVSPANFPSFLKKMWNHLLEKFSKDKIQS